jgi:hypothetical protein
MANNTAGFNAAQQICAPPWFQDLSVLIPGRRYIYKRFAGGHTFDLRYDQPIYGYDGHTITNYKFSDLDNRRPDGTFGGLWLPAILRDSCIKEIPIGSFPAVGPTSQDTETINTQPKTNTLTSRRRRLRRASRRRPARKSVRRNRRTRK